MEGGTKYGQFFEFMVHVSKGCVKFCSYPLLITFRSLKGGENYNHPPVFKSFFFGGSGEYIEGGYFTFGFHFLKPGVEVPRFSSVGEDRNNNRL